MDKMSKPIKILLGLLTIWPTLYIGIACLFMSDIFTAMGLFGHGGNNEHPSWFIAFIIVHILTIFVWNVLMAFYVAHLILTTRIPGTNMKALWGALLYFFNIMAIIVYFCMYVWPEPKSVEMAQNSA